jgi:hypothetical protein
VRLHSVEPITAQRALAVDLFCPLLLGKVRRVQFSAISLEDMLGIRASSGGPLRIRD